MPALLVVLGHRNHPDGRLYDSALKRCTTAVELLEAGQARHVLTTGSFGSGFNEGAEPHGVYLEREIRARLSPAKQTLITFLGFTATFNTVHDLYAARRMAEDLRWNGGEPPPRWERIDEIVIVTSAFHAPRVQQIAKRVLPDWCFRIVVAEDGRDVQTGAGGMPDPELTHAEARKCRAFISEWVAVPRYRGGEKFPAEQYREVREEHKHYDTISLTIVTGAVFVAFAPSTNVFKEMPQSPARWAIATLVACLLYQLYCRCARTAFVCRKVLETMEVAWDRPAVSFNYRSFGTRLNLSYRGGVQMLVGLVVCTGMALNAIYAAKDFVASAPQLGASSIALRGALLVFQSALFLWSLGETLKRFVPAWARAPRVTTSPL